MKSELVSVIIPTFNRAESLLKTLNSLQNQSYSHWECLIIDDGSYKEEINKILSFIKKEKKIIFKSRPLNYKKGPSACRNIGLEIAKGTYIQFFDDDDVMFPQMLEKKIAMIQKLDSDVVVSPLQFFNVKLKQKIKVNEIHAADIVEGYVLEKISWYVSGPLWKKSFLSENFDENIQTLDDWDFNLRNIYKKPKVVFIKDPLQYYNIYHPGATLSTKGQLGDEEQMLSLYITYKKHFLILKENKFLTPVLHNVFIKRFVFLLRFFLTNNNPVKKELFSLLKKELDVINKCRIMVGFYSYKYLGKGYRFFNF